MSDAMRVIAACLIVMVGTLVRLPLSATVLTGHQAESQNRTPARTRRGPSEHPPQESVRETVRPSCGIRKRELWALLPGRPASSDTSRALAAY
jgi:hypothetical protein